MLQKKLNASALQFAILVSVIVAILLGSFLTLSYTHQFFNTQSGFMKTAIKETKIGFNIGLSAAEDIGDSLVVPFENGTTTIKKKFWGAYALIESTGEVKSKSFSKIGLVGKRTESPPISLYVSNNDAPLTVVGDTKIQGDAYLSDKSIKPGRINNINYSGSQLVEGQIKRSSRSLPQIDDGWIIFTRSLLNPGYLSGLEGISQGDLNANSFLQPSRLVYNPGPITLSGKYIGNIIIKSETQIIVERFAELTDIQVVAPKIVVKSGFKGTVHFLASEQIIIEENVDLTYPSSVVVEDSNIDFKIPVPEGEEPIILSKNSFIQGNIMYFPKRNLQDHTNTSIVIEESSIVEGDVYCIGNLELKGVVRGTVYTDRFVVDGYGSKYMNYILNGKIMAASFFLLRKVYLLSCRSP